MTKGGERAAFLHHCNQWNIVSYWKAFNAKVYIIHRAVVLMNKLNICIRRSFNTIFEESYQIFNSNY
jgi:hypothetical protein